MISGCGTDEKPWHKHLARGSAAIGAKHHGYGFGGEGAIGWARPSGSSPPVRTCDSNRRKDSEAVYTQPLEGPDSAPDPSDKMYAGVPIDGLRSGGRARPRYEERNHIRSNVEVDVFYHGEKPDVRKMADTLAAQRKLERDYSHRGVLVPDRGPSDAKLESAYTEKFGKKVQDVAAHVQRTPDPFFKGAANDNKAFGSKPEQGFIPSCDPTRIRCPITERDPTTLGPAQVKRVEHFHQSASLGTAREEHGRAKAAQDKFLGERRGHVDLTNHNGLSMSLERRKDTTLNFSSLPGQDLNKINGQRRDRKANEECARRNYSSQLDWSLHG